MSVKVKNIQLWGVLIAALLIRLLTLGAYPLMDTTEARYGEMARLMVETGNWLTPHIDYGVPFWGKPPIFTWMSAAGIELFGVTEFAVRVPHWLAGVAVVILIAYFAKRLGLHWLLSATVLSTCAILSISAGAVMTDIALTFGITLAMVGFYLCWRGSKTWGYWGFVGLAIGLMAKGPLVIVLFGLAVAPWLVIQHGIVGAFAVLWKRFPLVTGTTLMFAISLPWYVLAERATPGFLDYFIVGEHIKRFLVSGWEGDLYGSAHDEARGTIWLFWLYSAAPWAWILPFLMWGKKSQIKRVAESHNGLISFLILWMLSPLILFTFAGNILPAYVLPGVPALALLIALCFQNDVSIPKWVTIAASVVPFLLIGAVVVISTGVGEQKSDKAIFSHVDPLVPVYYVGQRPFSGQFYSHGKAKQWSFETLAMVHSKVQLIGKDPEIELLIQSYRLNCIKDFKAKSERALYLCERS